MKSKESVETEDVFEIDNAEFPVSSMHDDSIEANDQALLESSTKKEDENAIHVSEDLGPPAVKAVDETLKKRFLQFFFLLICLCDYLVSTVS